MSLFDIPGLKGWQNDIMSVLIVAIVTSVVYLIFSLIINSGIRMSKWNKWIDKRKKKENTILTNEWGDSDKREWD